jgi:hypothetical protein
MGFCNDDCAVAYGKSDKAKKLVEKNERAELRARKEALKSLSVWKSEAQKSVNSYIRTRDRNKLCVSCHRPLNSAVGTGGYFDAGHFIPRGAARNGIGNNLRFHTLNIWGQCKSCNNYKGGAYSEYRQELINRIGEDRVKGLEEHEHIDHLTKRPGSRKWTIPECKRIKDLFNKRRRMYERKFR